MGKVRLNLLLKPRTRITIPVVISRYDSKWYMATAPQLDLVTQGRTPGEAKENMVDLLNLYFEDPHTPKPRIENLIGVDITFIPVDIPKGD